MSKEGFNKNAKLNINSKNSKTTGPKISYQKDGFRCLYPKYKYLCSLQKENVSKIINYNFTTKGEYSYGIYIDSENGTLIFVHETFVCLGAAGRDDVEYANVIQFDTLKKLLSHEIDYYKSLVTKWENNNDFERANLCKEHLQGLERIINVYSTNWKDLIK